MAAVQTTPHPHLSNPMHCSPLPQDALPKSGFFRRLSEWLWPVAYYDDYYDYDYDYDYNATTHSTTSPQFDLASGDPISPCKTCRMAGLACDGRRPHCSQCLNEQTLCFYVDPLRISRKKRKQSTAAQQVLPSVSEGEASCAS